MEHVRFGRTGLKVSRLCLGTMTFGYQCDEEMSFSILDAVIATQSPMSPDIKKRIDDLTHDYRFVDDAR